MVTFTASDGTVFEDRGAYRKYEAELSFTFKGPRDNNKGPKLVKPPGSIQGQAFDITDLHDVEVQLLDYSDQVQIDNVTKAKVLVAASSESVFVRDCSDCSFTIACKQLRTRDCHRCTFYLYSKTEPIIELSDHITFAPFNAAYPQHAQHMKDASLDPENNLWSLVFDFNDEAKTGKNWRLRDDKVEGPLPLWYPMGSPCELAVPIKEVHPPSSSGPREDGMQSFGISALKEASTGVAPSANDKKDKAKKKSAIGWDPSKLSDQGGDNATTSVTTTKKKSSIGWDPSKLTSQAEDGEGATTGGKKKKSSIGWDPSKIGLSGEGEGETAVIPKATQAQEGSSAVGAGIIKEKKHQVGWSEERLAEAQQGKGNAKLFDLPASASPEEGLDLEGFDEDALLRPRSGQAITSNPEGLIKAEATAGAKSKGMGVLGGRRGEPPSHPREEFRDVIADPEARDGVNYAEAPPSNNIKNKRNKKSSRKEEEEPECISLELQAVLLYAQHRGIDLKRWFQAEEDDDAIVDEAAGLGSPHVLVDHIDFEQKLLGLAKGLTAGMCSSTLAEVDKAISKESIDRAKRIARHDDNRININILIDQAPFDKFGHRKDPGERQLQFAKPDAAAELEQAAESSPARAVTSAPTTSTAVTMRTRKTKRRAGEGGGNTNNVSHKRKFLYELEAHVKDRLKAIITDPDRFHAIKVRLHNVSVNTSDLRSVLSSVGADLNKVEMETLMWSIRSTHDRVTAKGVPLRVMRQEVMHYLVQLRSDKPSTVVDEWQARRWRHREAHKKKIKTEFEKALHGQRFVLTHEEIERCFLSSDLVPNEVLDCEVDGLAQEWLYTEGQGTHEVRLKINHLLSRDKQNDRDKEAQRELRAEVRKALLEEKKAELFMKEEKAKELSRGLLDKYLTECRRANFRSTVSFSGWLDKRVEYWKNRRGSFKGWLQSKLEQVSKERIDKAKHAAALVDSQTLSSIKQGKDILKKFETLLSPSLRSASPPPSLDTSFERCFDEVLQTLKPSRGGFSSPPRAPLSQQEAAAPDDIVQTAHLIVVKAGEILAAKQKESKKKLKQWLYHKNHEEQERRQAQQLEEVKKQRKKEEQKKAAKAAFRRWRRSVAHNKYWSFAAKELRARTALDSKVANRQPWVDILTTDNNGQEADDNNSRLCD